MEIFKTVILMIALIVQVIVMLKYYNIKESRDTKIKNILNSLIIFLLWVALIVTKYL